MAKWITNVEWDEVPHLSAKAKEELYSAYLPHEKEARRKGIPAVGAGKIYPIPESEFVVPPFPIPPTWPKVYGLDVGWSVTAAVWGAYDEENDIIYIYREYKVENKEPVYHSAAIRGKQPWVPGVVDPAARGLRMKKDGISFLREFQELGLELYLANNAVDVGLMNVTNRLTTGRLKVFNYCQLWLNEYRIYRRKSNQAIHKVNDDLMDATRYLCMSGLPYSRCRPDFDEDNNGLKKFYSGRGKNPITGY